MENCLCLGCGSKFKRRGNVPNQQYCSRVECQRERKRLWQEEKMRCDEEYRANQGICIQRATSAFGDFRREATLSRNLLSCRKLGSSGPN